MYFLYVADDLEPFFFRIYAPGCLLDSLQGFFPHVLSYFENLSCIVWEKMVILEFEFE